MEADVVELDHDVVGARLAAMYGDERRPIELEVPVELVMLQGGFSYGDASNPFLTGLAGGAEALARFYEAHQPRDLAGMYGLERTGRPGEELAPWELPWLHRPADRRPPGGEKGLGPEHGVSYYGPASPEKVELEVRRLHEVRDSIEQRGYRPSPRIGTINGQLLVAGSSYRFLVRGGKHRAAALAALGWTHIPVRFRPTWPRLADRRDVDTWSLVVSGEVDASFAGDVFDAYFRPRQLPEDLPASTRPTQR